MKKNVFITTILTLVLFSLSSCVSIKELVFPQTYKIQLSRNIKGPGILTSADLTKFFMQQNPQADEAEVSQLAFYYVYEGLAEGINYTAAFAQMCLETGYLRYGNLVTADMHNYCGLGATDKDHPGERFETMQMGVRAHIQHLQAYATKEDELLNNPVIDPRYNWVHKAKYVTTMAELAGNWATDKNYGTKLESILCRLEELVNN